MPELRAADLKGVFLRNGQEASGADADKISIAGLSADSRQIAKDWLFAALPGARMDGATFIPKAIEQGATVILAQTGRWREAMPDHVRLLQSDDPRKALAQLAARFYQKQPETIVAITGTNGKTSVASFVRQIWARLGIRGASLGTVGIEFGDQHWPLSHTTPDPVEIHQKLAALVDEGVTHLAIEASSHGLAQRRLEGLNLAAAGFTNITQDHLDYHGDMESYFTEKLRLFEELTPEGAPVVIDADVAGAGRVAAVARRRGLPLISVGEKGETLKLAERKIEGYGQSLRVRHDGENYDVRTRLIGDFQSSNILVAAGLCMGAGARWADIAPALAQVMGAKGRMEPIGEASGGGAAVVDYAHTPDALENAILALRPIVEGKGRLLVVFGCGGDRDRGKRPLMGAAAAKHADLVYVTDDNPRSEDPAEIRREILAAAPAAIEIGDRRAAIEAAVGTLRAGDILLVAGKGHETGQTIGDKVVPFSDHEAVAQALGNAMQEASGE